MVIGSCLYRRLWASLFEHLKSLEYSHVILKGGVTTASGHSCGWGLLQLNVAQANL
ncbi:hypothetical protein SLEP1_g8669 [Rubroshorea leprosula]|uniref:Uncharacterized protein n=1 Tax=Rubroshorea leprosula TaxID=152421 RepID=A0AAV5I8H6_9ROSI|nr:hypothetical protein SLEP1_g8669 [Rubroshorea leprosula]